jgi:hypothetical protein
VYQADSEPVISCYPTEIVTRIDAMQSPTEVLHAILGVLIPIQNRWLESLPADPLQP